jgi:c(7)-type cytochrome triheme protein
MNETQKAQTNARRTRLAVKLCVLAAALFVLACVSLGSRAASSDFRSDAATKAIANASDTDAQANVYGMSANDLGMSASADDSGARLAASLAPAQQATSDFSKFSHTNMHARLPCLLCHRRETNSNVPVRSLGHSPCVGCHTQQFGDPRSPVCMICHASTDSAKPHVKPFPELQSFGFSFDHARHAAGAARASCATCHRPSGRDRVVLSIPSGASAHATCFRCHTPNAVAPDGHDISSCNTCHQLGRPARVNAWSSAYTSTPFSHDAHTHARLACTDCHAVRAGAPLARQVSAPFPAQHHAPAGTRSCASCHDNKRAFGGEDFNDCTRCHRGNAWHF